MIDIRLLEEKDKDSILNVMNSRELMKDTNIKIPDYSVWLNTKEPYTSPNIRQYGLFDNQILTHYFVVKIWSELPDDLKSYSWSTFSLKRNSYVKDSFGHVINTIKLVNFMVNDMELLGYDNAYAIAPWHPVLTNTKPQYMNPACRLNTYKVTEMETVNAGELPKSGLFRQYLVGRPYDIPLYIRNFYLNDN